MKLVLNKCFGGFGLSHEAMMEIFKHKGVTVYPYITNIDDDYTGTTWTRFQGQPPTSWFDNIEYLGIDPGKDSFVTGIGARCNEYNQFDSQAYDNYTNDADLVAVVEALGDEASGVFAELRIVEIPDGMNYTIDDYGGVETVYYGLQTGSV